MRNNPTETQVLTGAIKLLSHKRTVAKAARRNTGGMYDKTGRFVAFGEIGDADIAGYMANGLVLAIEVKRPNGWPSHEKIDKWATKTTKQRSKDQHRIVRQREELRRIYEAGGHAGVIEAIDEIDMIIGPGRVPLRLYPDTTEPPF